MKRDMSASARSPYTMRRGRKTDKERRQLLADDQPTQMLVGITDVHIKNKLVTSQIVANRGGARSSKSYSIAQIMCERFLTLPNRKIFIVRKTLPSLRISTLRVMRELLQTHGVWDRVTENKVEMNFTYGKNLIHFGSCDDPEKIRSTEWNDIWMEEATEFTYDDFVNLKLRLSAMPLGHRNQLFLSFNPTDEYSWIKTNVIDGKEDCIEIHSTYNDNPFLPYEYVKLIKQLVEQDINYHRIFALGEWGRLEHIIYSNWDVVQDCVTGGETIYGLDFGYTNPACLVKLDIDGDDCYADQLIYQMGLTNADLIKRMDEVIPKEKRKKYPIYADNAEPQRIEEINRAGFYCLPAEKDVADGIDMVKRFRLHITTGSEDGIKEIRGYSWRTDKNNRVYDEPVKFNDHFCDGVRYGLFTHCRKRFEGKLRIRSV